MVIDQLLVKQVGYPNLNPTLCIGLDIAWFGGSQNNHASKFDFIVAALIEPKNGLINFDCQRIRLMDRDPEAELTFHALNEIIANFNGKFEQVVVAIDAPLQATPRNLPPRQPLADSGTIQRRACEEVLNLHRKNIDRACGGSKGWHPNIQPGAPLAPRIEALLNKIGNTFDLWTQEHSNSPKLLIECFPAEAIWAAKRMGWYPANINAIQAKAYKKQKGNILTAQNVTDLITTTLWPFGNTCDQSVWNRVVNHLLVAILGDNDWRNNDCYPGGKMLDDVVDSMICLTTAIGYTTGIAHVWHDQNHPNDGHIIGPGAMQELFS